MASRLQLLPLNDGGRQMLADLLFEVNENGKVNIKKAAYVAKTFPDVLLDVARHLTEQATKSARESSDPVRVIVQQLKPYLMFSFLLGKSPQTTGLMYSYFENSSFQPLPDNLFHLNATDKTVEYQHPGFSDDLIEGILISYIRYLSFNPRWFSSVWNWSELGRLVTMHPSPDIRFLATCCLSIITRPTRPQHISLLREIIGLDNYQLFIDLQLKHRDVFENNFRPCIETKKHMGEEFANAFGICSSGYSYCSDSLAKVANILLLKRDINSSDDATRRQCQEVTQKYISIGKLEDTISRIAYSVAISKPCLIRGPPGSGKTSIIDYIAAHTNRVKPPDYVKVQIGDQIDSKLLIGSYVCTEIPGQFEWQPGPLTKALAYGSWIVFEDIDSAPSDMAQVIHSVIENGNLSCVSCCPIKLDSPHPDFRIFFTQRTRQANHLHSFKLGFGFIDSLCDIVDMPELSGNELGEIVQSRFKFGQLTSTILELFKTSETALSATQTGKARKITLRDLFKLCDRITTSNLPSSSETFASNALEGLFLDVVDCFISSLPQEDMKNIAETLGAIVNMPSNEVQRLVTQRKPEIREGSATFSIGRATLSRNRGRADPALRPKSTIAYTRQSAQLIESICFCIQSKEPVLLVGETGVGKTSLVQHIADLANAELCVINLSQQSDSSDLLGGFSPVEMREVMRPLQEKVDELFRNTFQGVGGGDFLHHANTCFQTSKKNSQWVTYLKVVCRVCAKALEQRVTESLLGDWTALHDKARRLAKRLRDEDDSSPMALTFSEGTLLKAVRGGKWILLDEINLAEPDVLQCLLLILDSIQDKYVYMHNSTNGDEAFRIHPNFRIFACMNPSTDVGKRDLAAGTRSRFTEFFVNDVTNKADLRLIVESYVRTFITETPLIERIVNFYQEVRNQSNLYNDISGNSPVYSLRTLCRALTICSNNVCHHMEKSLYESLKITFLQQLNESSVSQMMKLIEKVISGDKASKGLELVTIPRPSGDHSYVNVEGFWIQASSSVEPVIDTKYIVTKSVKRSLQNLARIMSLSQRRLPILIQGNTSVGKTSLITYLAKRTGNRCYRINNHEHTDLQEYVGRYILREDGELFFQEGLLVRAMRRGYWIILDELNLAPSELLEALNRVLDDNRELFIPETREVIKASSKFMLFATQNPPQEYAGRKLLSRAFRNRFIELHFDEIPKDELEYILHSRCEMAPQHASKIVSVMKELQVFRRESGCFNGKNSFMTLRDLFRWGERYALFKETVPAGEFFDWDLRIASEGLILLEGRVRTMDEAEVVKKIIEKVFNRHLDREEIYYKRVFDTATFPAQFKHIHFSREFQRLYVQLSAALRYKEPVLLCGQTGCGKTTACQLYAATHRQNLIGYNCHMNTESSDFVGAVRPSRDSSNPSSRQTFPWVNGPLVTAMKSGAIFLMDEISLADDAVLERINSVLEPNRSITLTEKDGEEIFAKDSFRIVATMNPGGDYGKKELSPALCNRFTEIYCHNTTDINQIRKVIISSLSPSLLNATIVPHILNVMQKFLKNYYHDRAIISLRDVLSWVKFINTTTKLRATQPEPLSIQEALINGASLVFFDQFGTCGHRAASATNMDQDMKNELKVDLVNSIEAKFGKKAKYTETKPAMISQDLVRFKRFFLVKGSLPITGDIRREFVLDTPMVKMNLMKIVRAMQLDRPILLEGDPGTGKTTIVGALAKLTGHKLVRINLSEQTDISDLFGSDLPDTSCPDSDTPRFCWSDGPLLKAIKHSHWILLDEMNLASQSVLEGLNACFDHRGEIYIAELNKKITVNRSDTRIFACQNPYSQGAARKGLPQSFLNRFTSIFVESHSSKDLSMIIERLYLNLPAQLVAKMIEFNSGVSDLCKNTTNFEFNLRDVLYWCDLMNRYVHGTAFRDNNLYRPDKSAQFVYLDRMRSAEQRLAVEKLFEKIFGIEIYSPPYRELNLGEYSFIIARSILPRKRRPHPHLSDMCILKYQLPYMESIAKAIEFNKMPILVGESGVGKRSMVKIIAGLTGNDLNILGANREMDTIELLGSFEQKSLQREVVDLVEEAKICVTSMINSIPHKEPAATWIQMFDNIWTSLYSTCIRDLKLSKYEVVDAYRFQLMQMKDLIGKLLQLSSIQAEKRYKTLSSRIDRLLNKFLNNSESIYSSGNFEWIESVLIKSIREGSWLMIENANLMNPATLDRLNSLVEPGGSLSLNEKGSGPDGIETLKPHQDFRLILTVIPEHGELSRAMRNRGVEIFVQPAFYYEDLLLLLNQNGFEPESAKACMTYCIMQTCVDIHKFVTTEDPVDDGRLLTYFGLNYLSTLTHQIRRGMDVDDILADLLISYYSQKGYFELSRAESIRQLVKAKMDEYRQTYEVNLDDERYKWMDFRHDLVSLSGGDAIPSILNRDSKLFFYEFRIEMYLRPDEMIENIDIVNTCIMVKIFLELSTHGDFDYRKELIKETFMVYPNMIEIVQNHVNLLHSEYVPLLNSLLPSSGLTPVSEMHVDTRNAPDTHYYLQSLDHKGTVQRENIQNRWLLSLHRIMLRMILDLIEERTMEKSGHTSLWKLSEKVRAGEMVKEDLIRPVAEIATDLHDILSGILGVVSNRCLDSSTTAKMIPRLFWISYFLCKLKRGYQKTELIAVCNQIPMLWALTYQKVIVPIIRECNLADLNHNSKKFSFRIQHICDFLDMTITKPSKVEKEYYNKVLNVYATNIKMCQVVSREVDKFFVTLISRFGTKTGIGLENIDTLATSSLIWSNSRYMDSFYEIQDRLLMVELAQVSCEDIIAPNLAARGVYEEAKTILTERKNEYLIHENRMVENFYRSKQLNINRRKNASDRFAPIWQIKFIHERMSNLLPTLPDPSAFRSSLRLLLKNVNGIMMSPIYYGTLIKYLQKLEGLKESTDADQNASKLPRQNTDVYTAFLVDHLAENIVLDRQVVGWTKLRVTTTDLPAQAPLIPEYSPILSLVGSYCLDIAHLKLNSHLGSSAQLDSMLLYLWRSYVSTKLDNQKNVQDVDLAKHLMHYRIDMGMGTDLVGQYVCQRDGQCQCVEHYIKHRVSTYEQLIDTIKTNFDADDAQIIEKAFKMIYFGHLNYLEYAPIFTLDPSLRSREKLEVYRSELAHVKLDLHFRNTLFYWKTGENLQLNEIEPDGASLYPFSLRILVERRFKLEKSISKLRREHTNRPKTDDGSMYYELRKEVEVSVNRYTSSVHSLVKDIVDYTLGGGGFVKANSPKFAGLISKCRMIIKSLEKSISRFRMDFSLYADLLTNFLVGMSFLLQGVRCLYSRLEQKMQILEFGYSCSSQLYLDDINRVFSFSNFVQGNLESVHNKLRFFPRLENVCPSERISHIQSILLRTVLIQLHHHICITPSDIEHCIPIVDRIANLFHTAWLKRKLYLEEQRKLKEELYEYKTSRNTLGAEISYDRQEFLDICSKFPTYDHIYQDDFSTPLTSADQKNMETEQKVTNLTRSVDLSQCIDICKAHYKFMAEASRNLLGQKDFNPSATTSALEIDLGQMVELEAETLYTIIRHCVPTLDQSFDSRSLECHLLQADKLNKILRQPSEEICAKQQVGSLKSSIEILDEEIFDIYHQPNANEALRFQDFVQKLDARIAKLVDHPSRRYEDDDPTLISLTKLITRISSFLITDPMMKFVTGSHTVLEKIEEWNKRSIPKDDKMIHEALELIDIIKKWRKIEIDSWQSSLHNVKRKFIDSSLCDLWFRLYEAFKDPVKLVEELLSEKFGMTLNAETEEFFYQGFALFIKDFIEDSTLGDYQIRLDLVFSFAIQTRFAALCNQSKSQQQELEVTDKPITVDHEKLTTYVYNTYRQYQGLLKPLKQELEQAESDLLKELKTEIRIVAWQGRNLWEIKNNFRISHRKLNKVMNKYLDVLRKPLPSIRPHDETDGLNKAKTSVSEELTLTLMSIQILISSVAVPSPQSPDGLKLIEKLPKIVQRMQNLCETIRVPMSKRHVDNLAAIEDLVNSNRDAIENYRSHKVTEVVIHPKDTKEIKENKHKLCRQMYNSKKFALQSIFKGLQNLGVSFQRGLSRIDDLDRNILSLEPLRGMIQNQSQSVLKAATQLVNDDIISSCNEQYRKLIASNMYLLTQSNAPDLTSDQVERIRGLALDMVLDIITHNRNAAQIYRYLINIQAAATRLTQLQERSQAGKTVVYNFSKIHRIVRKFNELVGRAYLATVKLDKLAQCGSAAPNLESQASDMSMEDSERSILRQLIEETDEANSLMTNIQLQHVRSNLSNVQRTIVEISESLRDMLNFTVRNHLYSDDDLERLSQLYNQFSSNFKQLLPADETPETHPNLQAGTIFGSILSLLAEAERELRPSMQPETLGNVEEPVGINQHPRSAKLNIRLQKLVRQTMLAARTSFKDEVSKTEQPKHLSETEKRMMRPFNYVNSSTIRNMLRLGRVDKHIGDCFVTLGSCDQSTDIRPIVEGLTPILFIYTQFVASYLNIVMSSISLKLISANELIPFFTDLILNGFGLPIKVSEEPEGSQQTKSKSGADDDNVGFGEGQGETDVSKKLEFESQLDELKKDGKDEGEKEKEDQIEAHDDGVEMSEDIDAQANGADEGAEKPDNNDKQDDDGEDVEGLDELDKEMDSVDQDEGQLDEKLWSDQEDLPGEDDEEDLRETELAGSSRPEKEDLELQAKDEQLTEAKKGEEDAETKEDEKQQQQTDIPHEKADQDPEEDLAIDKAPAVSKDPEGEEEEGDQELDLGEEAAQALKEFENKQAKKEEEEEGDKIEDVDMSISDNEGAEPDKSSKDETEKGEDEKMEVGEESKKDDEKKQDETSAKQEEAGEQPQPSSQDNLDDQFVDDKLEHEMEPYIGEMLEDPIEETIKNITATSNPEGQQKAEEPFNVTEKGRHKIYDIYDVEEDDPLDVGDHKQQDHEREESQQQQQEEQMQSDDAQPQPSGAGTEGADDCRDDERMPMDSEQPTAPEQNPAEQEARTEDEISKANKRTFAEREERDLADIKRQRILDAVDNDEVASQEEELQDQATQEEPQVKEETRQSSRVRHTGPSKSDAIEVIDLLSSSDDETPLEQQPDGANESRLAPKSGEEAKKDPKAAPKTTPSGQVDQQTQEGWVVEPCEQLNPDDSSPDSLESISSLETGELANSDGDDNKENDDKMKALELEQEGGNSADGAADERLLTTYNTNFGLLKFISLPDDQRKAEEQRLLAKIDEEVSREPLGERRADDDQELAKQLTSLWLDCTRQNGRLVHELCQQLQIVLQPTKMSKYKGDYKTGKRLNMRKIVSYIASHYRKDKIWLRRTKPNKRTYSICLAVDNSSSMAENNCRRMTYQSLALLAKSLSIIESGELSVLSFGERVNCLHSFGDTYEDARGARWLRDLRFNERRTSYGQLLSYAVDAFAERASEQADAATASVSQLLIIISDGRNVTSEEKAIRACLKQLRSQRVLTLFVIIDDLSSGPSMNGSIVDVKRAIISADPSGELTLVNYMQLFPFPFYVLLRQLNAMPSILGDALRQWFELVSSSTV